ncbi:MAG: ATP-binding protein [Treponemataceae bacterium]|nr:ATP-binding protein [Treponemataceae bacterium]HOJ99297.1 ATP-binding protein [Termitinemataceae bacterium]HOM24317.1 ATP-binding protein [Termitinemataceae bacterium]HPQ00657.1 ATP-binding protein [Termitinemataceae bacterium]
MPQKGARRLLFYIESLVLFKNLKEAPFFAPFYRLLSRIAQLEESITSVPLHLPDKIGLIRLWTDVMHFVLSEERSLHELIIDFILHDENPLTLAAEALAPESGHIAGDKTQRGKSLAPALLEQARLDLLYLQTIASCTTVELIEPILSLFSDRLTLDISQRIKKEEAILSHFFRHSGEHPLFPSHKSWDTALEGLLAYWKSEGVGHLGKHSFLVWKPEEEMPLQPALLPDPIRLSQLFGYEAQRAIVLANTRRFISGHRANNLLLYGDRGTGKSATVKAVCNEFAGEKLRLVSVDKQHLQDYPRIIKTLSDRPYRFILYIDDLSFETLDDSYTGLKALLEGGVNQRPDNVVIYATSNRRHLVRESRADRPDTAAAAAAIESGDMRAFDTMQEQLSLADRFGLTVVFSTPGQEEYLTIVQKIAQERGLTIPGTTLREQALRWEKWFNGRSPRSARQFVDWIEGGMDFPWDS